LRAALAPGAPEGALAEVGTLLRAFAGVGSLGGFAVEDSRPEQSTLHLSGMKQPFERVIEMSFEADRVDSRAFLILKHALISLGADVHPVESLQVEPAVAAPSARELSFGEVTWNNVDRAYPARSKHVDFPVEFEEYLDNRKRRRCLIDLGYGLGGGALEPLTKAVRDWVTLVEACGFSPPVARSDQASMVLDSLEPFDESSLEVVFGLFDSSEAAWDVLLNVLAGFSRRVAPVASVEIA
jgi:hypothetical protein